VVALVVAVGLVLGAWMLVRAGGSSGEVAPPRVTSTGTAPVGGSSSPPASPGVSASPSGASPVGQQSGTAGTGTAGSGGKIVVDVVGKVRHPGIAVLPPGSRVVDAVRASGGLRRGVARRTVNLARVLNDGEQVLIGVGGGTTGVAPSVGAASGSSSASPGTPLVNINTADETALESLPGVGPVTAQAILQWRGDHGGFTSVDELLEVSGIGDATLAEIAPFVTL
jgi:competence protein ComEA